MNDFLHPEFAPHAKNLMEIIRWAQAANPEPEEMLECIARDDKWNASYGWAMELLMQNRVACLGGFAYGVPMFSATACTGLLQTAQKMGEKHGFTPNHEEAESEQIPEIVVKHYDESAYGELVGSIEYMNVWFLLIYHTIPKSVSSIQFTKYEPSETPRGNWHHDLDSDFTAVVSLAPELFEGGGTDLRLTPTSYFSLDKLPKGYALLFNGKQIQHRGRAVTSGVRHLLTFWLDSAPESDTLPDRQV